MYQASQAALRYSAADVTGRCASSSGRCARRVATASASGSKGVASPAGRDSSMGPMMAGSIPGAAPNGPDEPNGSGADGCTVGPRRQVLGDRTSETQKLTRTMASKLANRAPAALTWPPPDRECERTTGTGAA